MSWKRVACAALAMGLEGCSYSCTEMACGPGFTWTSDSPVGMEALANTEIEVCRNDHCFRGPTLDENRQGASFGEETSREVEVLVFEGEGGGVELDIWWWLRDGEAEDGDVYRMTLFDAEGEVLEANMEAVDYRSKRINGRHCEPVCTQASVDRRSAAD
jgi:hypothetical protein